MPNLFIAVGRSMAVAIDRRMAFATLQCNTELMRWLEFVTVRWGCNTSIAGSTAFAKEVHDTMGRLLTHLRTADGGHFTIVVDTFASFKSKLTSHESIVHPHDLEVLVPTDMLILWLHQTSSASSPTDLGAFIRLCNDETSPAIGTAVSSALTTSASIDAPTPTIHASLSRVVANPLVSLVDPPADREGLDAIIAAARKRILHLVKLRRRVEEIEYQAIAGKAADIAKASEPRESMGTMMKDISIGFDMRLMALAGGVVGYYLCHIRGKDGGTCWVGAIVGVIIMTVVDAVLMIIRIGKDDVRTNKAKKKEATAIGKPKR